MCFSALQRAENSSNFPKSQKRCSSKPSFSALQRAENSSKFFDNFVGSFAAEFQCSSASRKFLKSLLHPTSVVQTRFQCSSASRKFLKISTDAGNPERTDVSVLFSEPKIPQTQLPVRIIPALGVSVLFSEPKIPQTLRNSAQATATRWFQCSSASRKFLKLIVHTGNGLMPVCFSALQRAENSSKRRDASGCDNAASFSALQRAENSSRGA